MLPCNLIVMVRQFSLHPDSVFGHYSVQLMNYGTYCCVTGSLSGSVT